MSFQAYIDTIQAKTGLLPKDFKELAIKKGFLSSEGEILVKATPITDWLKAEYSLGHGHAMAIFASFKGYKGGNEKAKK